MSVNHMVRHLFLCVQTEEYPFQVKLSYLREQVYDGTDSLKNISKYNNIHFALDQHTKYIPLSHRALSACQRTVDSWFLVAFTHCALQLLA